MTRILPRARRPLLAAACVGAACVAALAGCNDLLDVQRPTIIAPENVGSDSLSINAMVAGAEAPFRREYAWVASAGAGQTDEAFLTHVWSPWNQYDDRNVTADGGAYNGITYPFLQQARATGAAMVQLLARTLGDRKDTHPGYARANAYAGYSHLLVADHLCAIPIDGGAARTPDQVRDLAIGFLGEAARVGAAASAPDVVDLANVGIARAALGKGDRAAAIAAAAKVRPDFVAQVRYVSNPDFFSWTVYNLYQRLSGLRNPAEFTLGYDPETIGTLDDRRVPFETTPRRLLDSRPAARYALLPFQPSSFSGWTPGGRVMFTEDAAIRFASGLEARYVLAEASLEPDGSASGAPGAWSVAQVQAFVDERRAVGAGRPDPFTGTGQALFDELLRQRMLDFMLAGYRMPDLIRYKRFYGRDWWPQGRMGGFTSDWTQSYGSTECWPIGLDEKATNPNV